MLNWKSLTVLAYCTSAKLEAPGNEANKPISLYNIPWLTHSEKVAELNKISCSTQSDISFVYVMNITGSHAVIISSASSSWFHHARAVLYRLLTQKHSDKVNEMTRMMNCHTRIVCNHMMTFLLQMIMVIMHSWLTIKCPNVSPAPSRGVT